MAKKLILPTALAVTKREIEYWTNMTCLYDKNWAYNPKLATTPVSFLHIMKVTESIAAQGSEKRVILYEAPKTDQSPGAYSGAASVATAHPSYKSNLEIIMDNVVVHPKQYQMDVLIADSLIGPYINQGIQRLSALISHMDMIEGKDYNSSSIVRGIQNVTQVISTAQEGIDVFERLLGGFIGSTQMSTINKNSLEAMASAGHVVVFKKWTGYNFAYGILTKVDIAKVPQEFGVSRATLTFQETPILNITQKSAGKTSLGSVAATVAAGANSVAQIANMAIALPFIALTGVAKEAGMPEAGFGSAMGFNF